MRSGSALFCPGGGLGIAAQYGCVMVSSAGVLQWLSAMPWGRASHCSGQDYICFLFASVFCEVHLFGGGFFPSHG